MAVKSLRIRLLAAAAIVVSLVLVLAGFALVLVFERNVIRTTDIELDAYIDQLESILTRDENGHLTTDNELADPRFRRPYGGRYWQISSKSGVLLRSRSLWDTLLTVDDAPAPGTGVKRRELAGPDNQVLYAAVTSIILEQDPPPPQEERYVLVAAIDRAEVNEIKAKFGGDIVPALGVFAAMLIAAAWIQVSVGLTPLEKVRIGLEAVRLGEARRLDADVPQELQPLVTETNRLLEAQETALVKARARAGDLAHGLKTPLTALSMLADGLRNKGQAASAQDIQGHIECLARHVERELARSRIAAGTQTKWTLVESAVSGLVKTISRLPRGDIIEWRVNSPPSLFAAVDEVDLAEILGNLLDNARKWTRSVVTITVARRGREVEVLVEDDGAGIPERDRPRALNRGIRLDERVPGSGFGLTIAKDIVEAYNGKLDLGRSDIGGLRVSLVLPAADHHHRPGAATAHDPSYRLKQL